MGSMRLNDVVAEIVGDVIAGRAINKRQAATARWHDIDADGQYLAGIDGVVTRIDHRARALRVKAERGNALCQAELPFQLPAAVGKGYAEALTVWREYLDKLNALRDRKGMVVIQIAHTDIKRFDSPEHEPYDRYVIKLQTRASALLQEHSDVVLFANYEISVTKSDVGFNKKVTRALGSGARVMHTEERPAFLAKNRYGLPDTLPLEWSAFVAAMPHPE